jgi:hypothetical protein
VCLALTWCASFRPPFPVIGAALCTPRYPEDGCVWLVRARVRSVKGSGTVIHVNDRWRDEINRELAGLWQAWYVTYAGQRAVSWHARPAGAPTATISAWSADDMLALIADADPLAAARLGPLRARITAEAQAATGPGCPPKH